MVLVEINTPFLEKQKVTFKLLLGTELERVAKKIAKEKDGVGPLKLKIILVCLHLNRQYYKSLTETLCL